MFSEVFRNSSLLKRALQSATTGLEWPYRMTFWVSKECHSRCQNCEIWKVVPKDELTLSEIERIAEQYPYLSWINLSGGEPTDRRDLVEIVRVFKKSNPDLALLNFSTNGLNTSRIVDVAKRILEVGVQKTVISVSIDGPPEVNDEIRGIKGDFDRATRTARELFALKSDRKWSKKFHAVVSMTLYERNKAHIMDAVNSLKAAIPGFSAQDLHLNIGHRSKHAYDNEHQSEKRVSAEDQISKLHQTQGSPGSLNHLLERVYQKAAIDYMKTRKMPLACSAISSTFFISEKGEVFPCTIWNESLGNVRGTDYDLKKILKSSAAAVSREKIQKRSCPNCWSPCEAFPSIAAAPLKSLRYLLK